MNNPFDAPVDPRLASPPRFSLGRRVGRGLAACLWLWTATGAMAAAPDAPANAYGQALESFQRQNYARALELLERLPDDLSAKQRADALNLRGAVLLRQRRFDQARTAFAEASRTDPKLWAARYNEAEVSFRQKRYDQSRAQFDTLLDRTSRVFHPEEHRFLDYKARLAALCAGNEQPALEFIAEHRDAAQPPSAWYYLNAALEQRHARPQKADQWLAHADAKHPGGSAAYAESFRRLGWSGSEADGTPTGLASSRRATLRTPAASADKPAALAADNSPASSRESATVAAVEILPERDSVAIPGDPATAPAPGFRYDSPPVSTARPAVGNVPPTDAGLYSPQEKSASQKREQPVAGVLVKPRRGRGTPTPAPSASPTPSTAPSPSEPPGNRAGTTPTASPEATPAATPSPTPAATPAPTPEPSPAAAASADYTQKYEAAYVKFLEKDYPATLTILGEADAIQPKQPQTATLRAQVFKQEYEAAYLCYRRNDFTGALTLLDQADLAQPNYPDALNLRGLVYSKQRVYDRAEGMFKKAIAVDPTLWAAKFNYAELPFNRGDYTTARSRFEDLLAETDAAKRPREAELTQYKVFLTLLLEGKTDQARSFMEHFNFSGATPAKYFCNAAMNFRAGTVDKATGWIDSAKREYPATLVSIFMEPFYRLGWMADPSTPGTALAGAASSPAVEAVAPSVTPAPAVSPKPPTVAANGTASPPPVAGSPVLIASSSPAAVLSPTATPIIVAAASPTPSPVLAATASPKPTPVLAATASPSPAPVVAAATPSPSLAPTATPKLSPAPVVAVATPSPSLAPINPPKPSPSPTAVPAVAAASAAPTHSPTASPTPSATVAATTAQPEESPAQATAKAKSSDEDVLRWGIIGAVLLYGLYVIYQMQTAIARKKARRRLRARNRAAVSPEKEIETPR